MKTIIAGLNTSTVDFLSSRRSEQVFCGFSGGADSTALLLLLKELSERLHFKLKAVHFQHGLRGQESVEDARFCAKFCGSRNIELMEINLDVRKALRGMESFEDVSRRLRLKEWKILASNQKSVIALGHNSDDRNENIIIRLLRGSNVSGLTSLREIQTVDGITIIRPLLNFSRAQIEEFLCRESVSDWRNDVSNEDNQILRNYIRNVTLSELSDICDGAKEGMKRAAMALEDDAIFIERETEKIWKELSSSSLKSPLPLTKFSALPRAIKIRVLRKWLSMLTKKDYVPGYELINRIDEAIHRISKLENKNRIKIPLQNLPDAFIEITAKSLEFAKTAKTYPAKIWDWRKKSSFVWDKYRLTAVLIDKTESFKLKDDRSAYFDASKIPKLLKVGPALEGERMKPFGSTEEVRVKKIFENRKIPSSTRKSYPILKTPETDRIIWIAGVRRSDFAPAKKNQPIVKFSVEIEA